jgi:hypothetical protein
MSYIIMKKHNEANRRVREVRNIYNYLKLMKYFRYFPAAFQTSSVYKFHR